MFAAIVANFVVGSEILTGGAGVIAGMTGINAIAGIWLLPLVIVAYGRCLQVGLLFVDCSSLDWRTPSHFRVSS
jgi:hypothetical protein